MFLAEMGQTEPGLSTGSIRAAFTLLGLQTHRWRTAKCA